MVRENHMVIIVGTGADLGLELARQFGSNGFDVIFMGRNEVRIREIIGQLLGEGITTHFIFMDLTNDDSIGQAFLEADKFAQPVDGLIYNAVARRTKRPAELTAGEVAEDLNVNLLGAIRCSSRIVERYKRQNGGFILFTGGGVALSPSMESASMSIGKAALRNYALNLAQEFNGTGIYIGTVTISRKIQSGTAYAPERIAETYIKMVQDRTAAEIIL